MKNEFEKYATNENNPKWQNSIKREKEIYKRKNDIRSEFERDYNRILHCNAYRRMKHKTQVFFSPENDHICTRIEHVMHVESVSYTIAKYLGLNTELTKAIATGHDIGHSPFGHEGERILSQISERDIGEKFWHERNGMEFVDKIELLEDINKNKQNLNLTYAVRDGIISHCGEIDENCLKPREENINLNNYKVPNQYSPYTWEGCVVKISDKISYLGRDIEDAISLGILDKISKELSKNKSKGKSSSPFDYIKNSEKATGWDAFINNLNWASTLALVSFALALICIVIFVIFTIKKIRNKRKGLPNVKVKSNKSDVSGSHAIIEDDEEDNFDEISSNTNAEPEETQNISSHAKSAHGGAEDYGDDYDEEDFKDVHYVKPADKPKKKKLKQDTSEIIIPNKYKR